MEREAEDQHDETGSGGQRDLQGGIRAPWGFDLFLNHNDLTGHRFDDALGGEGA